MSYENGLRTDHYIRCQGTLRRGHTRWRILASADTTIHVATASGSSSMKQ